MGQVIDDFDDADITMDPAWNGNLSAFVGINGELRSNYSTVNAAFYISTPSTWALNAEWRLDCRFLFNPSSVNYIDVMVMSDSMNLSLTKNGYFIRLGGTTDEISLFKIKNGVETKIIDGKDGLLNTSNNHYEVILQRFKDSFVLKHVKAGGNTVTEGTAKDSIIRMSSHAGIRIRQSTASFVNKHFFDNLYIGPLIRDTLAPVWDSLIVLNHKQLKCGMNEACDTAMLKNPMRYYIIPGKIYPVKVSIDVSKKSVILQFKENFVVNTWLSLHLDSIGDKSGNMMTAQAKNFYDSRPDSAKQYDLLITELMVDPDPQVALPIAEYIEITNVSGKFIHLNACKIHDPTSFKLLPDMVLAPDSILVLKSIPSLNNAEDRIWLSNQKGEVIHQVQYTDAWYKNELKKAGGYSLEMIDYTQPCRGFENWMASKHIRGGTPGDLNSVKGNIPGDTTAPALVSYTIENDSMLKFYFSEPVDSISLLNVQFTVNGQARDFVLKKLEKEPGIVSWLVPFQPDRLAEYRIGFSGVEDCSANRQKNIELNLQWPSESLVGQILINEVLFNPRSGGSDFIELYNHSSLAFDLSKHFLADLDAGGLLKNIYCVSSSALILKPHQFVLISEDTANICKEYDCQNHDMLKIQMGKLPSMPDEQGSIVLLNLQNIFLDSLHYLQDWHFPLLSDRNGVSLERLSYNMQTNMRDNWHSAASTAGYATPGYRNSQFVVPYKTETYFNVQSKTLSPDEDGFEDVMVLRYALPAPDFAASVYIYDMEGRLIRHLVNNQTLGTEGILTWDGTDEQSQRTPVGIYIVWIECINAEGKRIREKLSIVVAARL